MDSDELAALLPAIDRLVGQHVRVELFLEIAGLNQTLNFEGVAEWRDESPECASRFLTVGDSGLPVGSHGCEAVQVLPTGVRWRDILGRYSIDAS